MGYIEIWLNIPFCAEAAVCFVKFAASGRGGQGCRELSILAKYSLAHSGEQATLFQ